MLPGGGEGQGVSHSENHGSRNNTGGCSYLWFLQGDAICRRGRLLRQERERAPTWSIQNYGCWRSFVGQGDTGDTKE